MSVIDPFYIIWACVTPGLNSKGEGGENKCNQSTQQRNGMLCAVVRGAKKQEQYINWCGIGSVIYIKCR